MGALLRLHKLFLHKNTKVFLGSWEHPDNLGNQWLFWGIWENWIQKNHFLYNQLYYHPTGDSPWLAGNAMDSVFALPLTLILGWPTGVNFYVFILFLGIGFAGFFLGKSLQFSFWASVFLGCTIQSSTYLVFHANAGRFSQINIIFLLLGFAYFIQISSTEFFSQKKWSYWKLPLSLLFCGIGYWYHIWFFVLFASIYTLFYYRNRVSITNIATSALGSLLLCLPFLYIYLSHWTKIPGTDEIFPSQHAIADSLQLAFPLFVYPNAPQKMLFSEGLSVILFLGFLFLQKHTKKTWLFIACWSSIGILGVVLSMGVHTPLYELIYGNYSLLQRFWWPSRHILLYKIAIAVLATKGFDLWISNQTTWNTRFTSVSTPICLFLQGLGAYGVWVSSFAL